MLGKFDQAEKTLKKAIKLDPKTVDGNLHLGLIKIKQGDLKNAKEYFIAGLKINPKHENALIQLAVVEDKLKNYKKAKHYYEQVLVLNNNSYEALLNLGVIYERNKKYDTAKQLYILALKHGPNRLDFMNGTKLNLAAVLIILKKNDLAALVLKEVLKSAKKGSPMYMKAVSLNKEI